jgi:dephospho-CoA kinase
MIKVGVTGGIGSGKSTICKIFETLGYPVFYSDNEAKKIITNNTTIQNEIKSLLGEESFSAFGAYNTEFVSKKVFEDNLLLTKLNQIIHPAVREAFATFCKNTNSKHVFQESALLFENKLDSHFDEVIYISSPISFRIKNILKRNKNLSIEEIKKIIDKQLPEHLAIGHADLIICNDDKESIIEQVEDVLEIIK